MREKASQSFKWLSIDSKTESGEERNCYSIFTLLLL